MKKQLHSIIWLHLFLLSLVIPSTLKAQTALVKDVDPGTNGGLYSTGSFVKIGTTAYFVGYSATSSYELWKTDGTTAGTVIVKDINPGAGNANPSNLTVIGSTLYFLADNGTNGKELWKSDGTSAGTVMVKDIYPGVNQGPDTYSFIVGIGSTVYFVATDGVNGYELWKSDGTSAGTVMVKDLATGSTSAFPGYTNYAAVIGSTLYFTASTSTTGYELYKSDGTSAGTSLVKDIYPGVTTSDIVGLTVIGTNLYFRADNGTNGPELWKSDGTTAGTAILKDIYAGATGSSIQYLYTFNGALYFPASNGTNGVELWKSDGTTAGTVILSDIYSGASGSSPSDLFTFNNALYFNATNAANGKELWKTDGTAAGTALVKDINSGSAGSNAGWFTSAGTVFYFSATTAANGEELWKSDGTNAGTVIVRDINPGTTGSAPNALAYVNGTLFFAAEAIRNGVSWGNEPWKTDGTSAGTLMLNKLTGMLYSSNPVLYFGLNGITLFTAATEANGRELFKVTTGHYQQAYFTTVDTVRYTNSNNLDKANFLDHTVNDPSSWSWSFSGATPSTSTVQNPTNIQYTTPGCFNVTLTANFPGGGTSTKTRSCYVKVYNMDSSYYYQHHNNNTVNNNGGTYFTKVKLNTINNTSGTPNGPDYTYYNIQTSLIRTNQYKIYFQTEKSGAGFKIDAWIDYNRNGWFEANENLGSIPAFGYGSFGYSDSITFTVPAGTYYGKTRLRVKIDDQTTSSPDYFSDDGEIEDYNIMLTAPGGSAPVANFSASSTSISTGGSVNFTDLSTNSPTSWSWSFTGGTPSTSTAQNPTGITYPAAGCYQVTLTATNANGSDQEIKSCYINVSSSGSAPVANFTANSTNISVGGTVNFTDQSTNSPTSWSWSFTGGTPSTSTAQNPTGITYPTAGCYQVTLTATNSFGSNQNVKTCYINVGSTGPSYCSITSTTGTTEGDYIDGVSLGTINNQNTGSITGPTYNNYTSMSTTLSLNSPYTIAIKAGQWPASYPDYYGAWIDYNRDGDFNDASEKLGEFLSTGPGVTQNISFTVPSSALTGTTRLRVRGVYNSSANIDPCFAYSWGETEDYSVNITTGTTSASCDSLENYSAANTPVIYTNSSGGYISGHNSFLDVAKADKFSGYTPGYQLTGAYIYFAKAKYSTTAKTISVKVWNANGTSGTPGTVLATKTITIASFAPNVTAGTRTYVQFASPVNVSGPFYLGIEFSYASGDTVAIYTNMDGQTTPGTAWEKWSDGTWHAYSDATNSWGVNLSHFIQPVLCSSTVTAITEERSNMISLYPNPTAGQLTIEGVLSTETLDVVIMNSVGQVVYQRSLSNGSTDIRETIDLSENADGVYFVRFYNGITTETRRIVITR